MGYADNTRKLVVVLNGKHQPGRLMNAGMHLLAGLVGRGGPAMTEQLRLLDYKDATGDLHAALSTYPIIVLEAKNGNQIKTLREAARAADIPCADFVDAMLGGSADEQLANTAARRPEELDYLACCLWGEADRLDPMTKRFSLFKG